MAEEKWDFVDRYVKLMSGITDAPQEYHEACALFLISTMASKNFMFMSLPDAEIFTEKEVGGKQLNLWFIFIGKSRISRKSTAISRAKELIQAINEGILLPDDFTPQALVKVLNRKFTGGITRAVWINDEISGFFEQLKNGGFMTSTDALLSKIYDGRSYYRETIQRGEEKVINPYLTVLLASTEYLPTLFTESSLRQGFLNRFIYVVAKRQKRLPLRSRLTEEEKRRAEELKRWLATLERFRNSVSMSFTAEAKKIYDKFEEGVERRIEKEDLGLSEGYWGNLPNLLIRLACIYRISRMTAEELEGYSRLILTVEPQDVERAKAYLRKVWKWWEEVDFLRKTVSVSRELYTEEKSLTYVYNVIRKLEQQGLKATRTRVNRLTNLLAEDLDKILQTLEEQGRIRKKIKRTGLRGPPTIIYETVDTLEKQ